MYSLTARKFWAGSKLWKSFILCLYSLNYIQVVWASSEECSETEFGVTGVLLLGLTVTDMIKLTQYSFVAAIDVPGWLVVQSTAKVIAGWPLACDNSHSWWLHSVALWETRPPIPWPPQSQYTGHGDRISRALVSYAGGDRRFEPMVKSNQWLIKLIIVPS